MIHETTTVSSSSTGQINLSPAASLIGGARLPITPDAGAAVDEVLKAECGQISNSVSEKAHAALRSAEAAGELAAKRLIESETALKDAEQSAANGHDGSWIKVLIWSFCTLACFGAEFVLTWTALCFVLDVPRMTALGVLLGLAPPSGLAILEIFLARIFEEPWQRVRHAPASARKTAVNIGMAAFLTALALANGFTIYQLAQAREEAVKIQHDVLDDRASNAPAGKFDQAVIDRAVVAVSVCVSIDGSVFLLLALAQAGRLREKSRLNRGLAKARALRETHQSESAAAASRLKNAAEAWRMADEEGSLSADRYRGHCHFLLAERNAAARDVPIEVLVDRAIRLRFCP